MVVFDNMNSLFDVVFVVEATANMGAYIDELKSAYIIPALEHFNGGPPDPTDYGNDYSCTLYNMVTFFANDIAPDTATRCSDLTTNIHQFLTWLDNISFIGGCGEGYSHIAEGLRTALHVFDDIKERRNNDSLSPERHCILVCNSPPYHLQSSEGCRYIGYYCDQLANMLAKQGIRLSIMSPRKIPALQKLYEESTTTDIPVTSKDFTLDPRHQILLHGFQLQERAHTPVQDDGKASPPLKTLSPAPAPASMTEFKVPSTAPSALASMLPQQQPSPQSLQTSQPSPVSQQQLQQQQQQLQQQQQQQQQQLLQQQQQGIQQTGMHHMQGTHVTQSNMGTGPPPPQGQPPPPHHQPQQPLPFSQGQLSQHQASQPSQATFQNSQVSLQGNQPQLQVGQPQQQQQQLNQAQLQQQQQQLNQAQLQQQQQQLNQAQLQQQQQLNQAQLQQQQLNQAQLQQQQQQLNQAQLQQQQQQQLNQAQLQQQQQQQQLNQAQLQQQQQQQQLNQAQLQQQQQQQQQLHLHAAQPPRPMERMQMTMIQKHQSQQQQPQVPQPPVSMMNQYGQPQMNSGQMSQMSSSANEMDLFSDPIMPIHPSAPKTLGMGQQGVSSHQGQIQQHSGMVSQPSVTSGYQGIQGSQQSQMAQVPISTGQFQGQMLPGNQPPGGLGGIQQQIGQPQQQQNIGDPNRPHQLSDRKIIWRGQLEWQEKSKTVGPNSRITRSLGCMVSIGQTDQDINASSWPGTLIMQLMPQALLNSPKLNPLFKNSRQVAFHFHQTNSNLDALKNLYRVMGTGFAGCVHFPTGTLCEVRVLLLLFSTRRKAFVGLIPNDQAAVVNGIREVITLQKQRMQQAGPQTTMGNQVMAPQQPGIPMGPNPGPGMSTTAMQMTTVPGGQSVMDPQDSMVQAMKLQQEQKARQQQQLLDEMYYGAPPQSMYSVQQRQQQQLQQQRQQQLQMQQQQQQQQQHLRHLLLNQQNQQLRQQMLMQQGQPQAPPQVMMGGQPQGMQPQVPGGMQGLSQGQGALDFNFDDLV
ncbi:hypothetical protein ACJMK2_019499 [Sinanodonta woodiana]|uniref:Mediator of RNA polymerase II transcription subunit 25 n=1 Tax=Sinanodonta woodiana TaxID=1069815 RepID=A0ABD3TWD5_SINWO